MDSYLFAIIIIHLNLFNIDGAQFFRLASNSIYRTVLERHCGAGFVISFGECEERVVHNAGIVIRRSHIVNLGGAELIVGVMISWKSKKVVINCFLSNLKLGIDNRKIKKRFFQFWQSLVKPVLIIPVLPKFHKTEFNFVDFDKLNMIKLVLHVAIFEILVKLSFNRILKRFGIKF